MNQSPLQLFQLLHETLNDQNRSRFVSVNQKQYSILFDHFLVNIYIFCLTLRHLQSRHIASWSTIYLDTLLVERLWYKDNPPGNLSLVDNLNLLSPRDHIISLLLYWNLSQIALFAPEIYLKLFLVFYLTIVPWLFLSLCNPRLSSLLILFFI